MTATMTNTKETLSYLYHQLRNQDENARTKILDLVEKYQAGQKRFGFAGHFSAGKSTLINKLLERELLPSSPIPTSANIVHLKEGEPYTTAYFKNDPPAKFEGDIDFDTVKSLCKDGDRITRVDISRRRTGLPEDITLLDTPGVDSTNDADRLITESSLHTMDYLFYVMDYNHVQSEVNLKFLSEMQGRGVPFSVVINQIDKHDEQELSFEGFTSSVASSLRQWGIEPEQIYYISLKDLTAKHNQWEAVSNDFRMLFDKLEGNLDSSILHQAEYVLNESLKDKQTDIDAQLDEQNERYDELSTQVPEQAKESFRSFEEIKKEAEARFQKEVRSFIPNAYLMPGRLRDDAEAFLHSVQPKFKVGLLFSKRKTEEAQSERENNFYEALLEIVEKNLLWPLRDRMGKLADDYHVGAAVQETIQQNPFKYDKERLHDLVESGAEVTGAYVLRYTDQVANDIQQKMKSHVTFWWDTFVNALERNSEQNERENTEAYDVVHRMQEIEQIQARLKQERKHLATTYENWFHSPLATVEMEKEVQTALRNREESIQVADPFSRNSTPEPKEEEKETECVDVSSSRSTKEKLLATMNQFVEHAGHIDGLEELFKHLEEKRERLEHRNFTVALFGAFSAGKSSFANALLGESLLPSSPNPTTATINKISPPGTHAHKTVKVFMKSEHDMLEDLSEALELLHIDTTDLEAVFNQLNLVSEKDWNQLSQKKRGFLQAFREGYSELEERIGTSFIVEWDLFESYVSIERYSCFVESMELFYDCEWTKKGITLVDTPGADSVNARHTDVSFEYIKDADAILFVTYYNHPFSKADQSFLTQLGRVKDSFAMDKMFFLVNASDLAASEEELAFVESYISEQLERFQIRNPRLFSLSSKRALEEKRSNSSSKDSGIQAFEDRFEMFLEEELQQVLIESMWEDMHTITHTIHSFIQYGKLNEEERKEQLQRLEEDRDRAERRLQNVHISSELAPIENKTEKQVHYVHERMMLNGNDLFKQHVNPATIDGQSDSPREQLKQALFHFSEEVNEERKQELRAVSLRLERMIQERLEEEKERLMKDLRTIQDSLALQMPDWEPITVPTFKEADFFTDKEIQALSKSFRNTKSFFEKNEKELVKEDLLIQLAPKLKEVLNEDEQTIRTYYQTYWNERYNRALEEWSKQLESSFDRLQYRLSHPVSIAELERTQEQVEHLVERSN
ncbi:dynamin family protein [Halobacillus salinus]|uniref:dynamin family protein n=1 Tax=Halobacillus salinus TaxID=192814 RepID=UPI0009A8D88E|nr:dynamin family protein [Halobacillus salinus]